MKKREVLLSKAQDWLNKQEITLPWDYHPKLTAEQIQALLEGGNAWYQVLYDLEMHNFDYILQGQDYLLQEAAKIFEVDADNLHADHIGVDLNIRALIKQSRGYFTLPLGIEHEQMPPGYEAEYDDYAGELCALDVNPFEVDTAWPNIPERNNPLIDPNDVWDLWLNNCYSGEWVVLLDSSIVLNAAYHGVLDQYTILKAGANTTIHSYWEGSSSILTKTKRAIKVSPGDIIDDGNRKYGVQACCRLVADAWNGELSNNG